ncbi:type II toxin-antitoxin system antitoxin, RelB/DinJ family [Fructobacillus parabroussonetiae]|uniref:Type II toxin-antitoxin system antitoxin, RelB/DinJ family n=1 Tax=Fructobacillus parabroussonetiae TaxID=2713174 RepID=A0ABS5QYL7_9LACO|nr:type II toxin-antitoxin system antitoxin, RelB/DinJ family [Fructobacillus parabroussonetiae]MBS9337730.1 type II toxin-antitoxin system antitoxin, RelB/DinJ family [Fructobacillus parabroussonetiae]
MTTEIQVELDSRDKVSFERLCQRLGMTAQDAMQNFVIKTLDVGKMPFQVEEPNERLKKALASRDYVTFENPEDFLEYLYNDEDE